MSFAERARQERDQNLIGGDWEEVPVSSAEFFDKFLGEPMFPRQQELVDAALGTDPLVWSTTFQEVLALWGKGSGKDKTVAKFIVYVVYLLLCMRNPQQRLGLGVGDKLEIVNVCINAQLANAVFFKYFTELIRRTINPKTGKNWFEEHGLDIGKDIKKKEVTFPKNITAYSLNSEEYTAEGMNLLLAVFDEIAGFEVGAADQLYKALKSSARSRFPQHMKILMLSYKRSDTDYMMTRWKLSENDPTVYRSGPYATWEVNEKRKQEDFAPDYISDPETSQRTYECKGSTSEGGFIKYKNRISQVINKWNNENPIVGDLYTTRDLKSLQFKDFFKPVPLTEYFIHIDLAKGKEGGDACGFVMGHYQRDMIIDIPEDHMRALVAENPTLSIEELRKLHGKPKVGVKLDLILQIRAMPGTEIQFEDVRWLVEQLKRVHKFTINKVTYDQFQSADSIQQLKKSGVNADEQSVDKDSRAYTTVKNLIYEGILEAYFHPILIRELEELIITNTGKVDHPQFSTARYMSQYEDKVNKGSKDVSDGAAGVCFLAIDRGKGGFSFGASGPQGTTQTRTDPAKEGWPDPVKAEQAKLVKYGEKPRLGLPPKNP